MGVKTCGKGIPVRLSEPWMRRISGIGVLVKRVWAATLFCTLETEFTVEENCCE